VKVVTSTIQKKIPIWVGMRIYQFWVATNTLNWATWRKF